jgi:hypothetical protein
VKRGCDLLLQATLAFNALRNATSHFTMSCGLIRRGTSTSAIFRFLVRVRPQESGQKLCVLEGAA